MVLVVLGCMQVRSRVPFARPWIGPPGALLENAYVRVRGCPGLSRMPPKRARTCHWSLWHQEPVDQNGVLTPAQVIVWTIADIVVWNGEPKWGADSLPLFDYVLE
ncbi:hypothetical protein CRG98_005497 [Punica granatum]|uniref:Uncharacterized protein n=1 Tax=Punica granatum TaxID=22663 RepID=A0A2I0L075_PUNGR|nr:hypothetical protein CRG98_005497 [Punica granatum]